MTDESLIKKVEMGLIFGVPDAGAIRETMGDLKEALAERDKYKGKLAAVREAITKLEMARSDNPSMELYPLLTVLAAFVESVEGALDD